MIGLRVCGRKRAAPRDLDAVLPSPREIGEQREHFRARLEVMRGRQTPPLGDAGHRAFGDAEQRVMRLEIGGAARNKARWSRRAASRADRRDPAAAPRRRAPARKPWRWSSIYSRSPKSRSSASSRARACSGLRLAPSALSSAPSGPPSARSDRRRRLERSRERDMRRIALLGVEIGARAQPHQIAIAGPRFWPAARDWRTRPPCACEPRRRSCASPKSTASCTPGIGWTPALAAFSENSSAANRLLVSVTASAGCASVPRDQ